MEGEAEKPPSFEILREITDAKLKKPTSKPRKKRADQLFDSKSPRIK